MGNVDRHRRAHDLFNSGDFEAAAADFREDVTCTDVARGLTMKSRAEFVGWLTSWKAGFSDAHVTERRYIDGGDTTVCLFHGRGTHDGTFGPYAASGRRLDCAFSEIVHWDANGQADWQEIYYDQVTIGVQLGFIEPPPSV